MARPRKEGMEYFPHDTDASGDEKVDAMRALFGNNGYAFYFILCERIYRTSAAELDVSKPVLLLPLVKKLLVTKDQFEEMLDASFELNLFSRQEYESRGIITSNGIKKRAGQVSEMREKWRKSKENPSDKDVFLEENPVDNSDFSVEKTPQETGERKEKKRKDIKEEEEDKDGRLPSAPEEPKTAMDAYKFCFNQFNYTGHIQGYVVNLMDRGFTDAFIREVFMEMGAQGVIKPNVEYMTKLSEDWIAKGIYTRAEAKARREKKNVHNISDHKKEQNMSEAEKRDANFQRWVSAGNDPSQFVYKPSS